MDDGMHVLAEPVDLKVHAHFGGGVASSESALALRRYDHQVFGMKGSFRDRCRGDQDAPGVQADRKIAGGGGTEIKPVQRLSAGDELGAVLIVGLLHDPDEILASIGGVLPPELSRLTLPAVRL